MIEKLREMYSEIWLTGDNGQLLAFDYPIGQGSTAFSKARENLANLVTGVLGYLDLTHCVVHNRVLQSPDIIENLSLAQTVKLYEDVGKYIHQDHSNCQPYSN